MQNTLKNKLRKFIILKLKQVINKLQINCHERQLQGLERKEKVEGSQLRLYKAKEGSRKHEAIACLNILG